MYFLGLQNTSASDAALLASGEIIFSIIFALLIFKNERLQPIGYMSIILVIIGIIVVTTNLQFDKSSSLSKVDYGDILIIGATILWAVDNNISKVITQHVDIIKLIQLKSLIGGSMLFAFATLILNVPLVVNQSQIPYIILLGIVGFALSLYFFLYSLKMLGTIRTIIIFSTSSVFGLIFAFIFLNEPISVYQIIAVIAMLAGIYIVNRKNGNSENKEKYTLTNCHKYNIIIYSHYIFSLLFLFEGLLSINTNTTVIATGNSITTTILLIKTPVSSLLPTTDDVGEKGFKILGGDW
jgi:drug/metabolite transporter (DMT)-like permease